MLPPTADSAGTNAADSAGNTYPLLPLLPYPPYFSHHAPGRTTTSSGLALVTETEDQGRYEK